MNNLRKALIGLVIVLFIGCQEYGVQLRVENTSDLDFDRISVNNVSFGALKSKETSNYLPFENIYKAEFVEVVIGERTLRIVPKEFNDEEFYNSGDYKYVVDILNEKWLSIKFEEE